ncbi:MAG: HDOD domain-containing protein [Myxococcus sp.]|nr:HDOD domain-containing protein [Myxococcus sp.]
MTAPLRDEVLRKVQTLPVLPHVVGRAMSLDPLDRNHFDELVHLIETEPNYAVRLVAAANTVASHAVTPVVRIRDAVVRLGSRSVIDLILSMSVVRVFVPRSNWERGLWVHALEVAHVSRALARSLPGLDPELGYICGLLHDVGRFIMFDLSPAVLREVDEAAWDCPEELLAAERSICGFDHAELGTLACERWGLAGPLCTFIKHHHHVGVDTTIEGVPGKVARLCQVADRVAFSSVSPSHRATRINTLPGPQAEALLTGLMPAWGHHHIPQTLAAVCEALSQADALSSTLGLSMKA